MTSPSPLIRSKLISSLLCLVISTSLPSLVGSVARVSVTLHSFKNPENRLLDGTYCNTQDHSTPCLIKLLVSFTAPFSETFVTSEVQASVIEFPLGDDAILTADFQRIPNPLPKDTSVTDEIRLLTFSIQAYDYSAVDGNRRDVARFNYNNFAVFGIENYGFSSGHSTFNLTTNITCERDYYLDCSVHCVETDTSTCNQTDGSTICKPGWSGPNCDIEVAIPCMPNTSALHFTFTPDKGSYLENEQVSVTCDSGYRPEPDVTDLTCLKNGTWAPRWPYCIEIKCPRLSLPNGELNPDTVSQTSSIIGTVVNFSCLPGNTLNGSQVLSCQDDGTWNGTAPVCNVNLCPNISGPAEGIGYYSPRPPARHPGNVFKQSCGKLYVSQGPEERLCRNNGTWSGDIIQCYRKCTKFVDQFNGTISYSTEIPSEGSTAEFSCPGDGKLLGERTALCQHDGTWNITQTPECAPECNLDHILQESLNSTISPTTYKTDSLNVGYTLTFSCPGPYLSYLSSSPFMTCLESGEWNSTVPSCIPVVENIHQKMNRVLVSGLSVLSGVIASFFFIVLILVYVNKRIHNSSKQILDNESDRSTPRSIRSIKLNQISISQVEQSEISPRRYQNGRTLNNFRSSRVGNPRRVRNPEKFSNQSKTSAAVGISNCAYVEDF